MESVSRFFQDPQTHFFLFGPRGTGKTTWLRQNLGEGMKPVFKSEFTRQSAQADIYQDMVVNQLADNLTKAGGIGLAKGLNRDLNRQNTSAPKASGATAHD